MTAPIPDSLAREWDGLRQDGWSWGRIAREYGRHKGAVHRSVIRWRKRESGPADTTRGRVTDTQSADGGRVLDSKASPRIRTLDDLIRECRIDLKAWEIERHVVNKWEVGAKLRDPDTGEVQVVVEPLYQVKAWMRPRVDLIDAQAVVDGLIEDLARSAPKRKRERRARGSHLLEFALCDHHIGMLAWHEESGADYDSEIAEQLARHAVDAVLDRCKGYDVERVLFPLGNDWLHTDTEIDGKGGTTARGTAQDVDSRWPKMFRRASRIAIELVDTLRTVAPVDVVIVPGNHDRTRAFTLGEVLGAWYRADADVTVSNTASPRSYVEYGASLIGLGHGDGIKEADLPLIMAQEAAEAWGRTTWREFHRAHFHSKRVSRFAPARDVGGVIVRTMPSMVALDAWHAGRGYRHIRAAEALLWHREQALVGTIVVGVPDEYLGEVAA